MNVQLHVCAKQQVEKLDPLCVQYEECVTCLRTYNITVQEFCEINYRFTTQQEAFGTWEKLVCMSHTMKTTTIMHRGALNKIKKRTSSFFYTPASSLHHLKGNVQRGDGCFKERPLQCP